MSACEDGGVQVPRFCYHDRLSVAGNCRMCLVEVEKSPKPVASCAMPVMPGMKIFTNTPKVNKAREGVMEFLLANHPLDCPICDQGGECDLQDQSMFFGSDRSRFREYKRTVEDKDFGPLVKTTMTRCIHCTRCVRFSAEVAGVPDLGTTGRGQATEIGTYVEKLVSSELSGNIIDLCPVGALTSKPYAFTARPWELKPVESIDVMDAVGANIRFDTRGAEIMRVLPRLNEDVNEEWLADKGRFSYDGLKRQRLTVPLMRDSEGVLKEVTWVEALERVAQEIQKVKGEEISAVIGNFVDCEAMVAARDLFYKLGASNLEARQTTPKLTSDLRSEYTFNSKITGIEQADLVVLIGTNPRLEAPLINARIRKAHLQNKLKIASLGAPDDLTYSYEHLGLTTESLKKLADGSHPFTRVIQAAKKPMFIVGAGALSRPDGAAILQAVKKLTKSNPNAVTDTWNGFNVLHLEASKVGALDLGIPSEKTSNVPAKFVYLLGADDVSPSEIPKDAFVVYQGHHGDEGAYLADVILPGAAYSEKSATYVNTEGRVQQTRIAVRPPIEARNDWTILRALSEVVGKQLPYDNLREIRARMAELAPHLTQSDEVQSTNFAKLVMEREDKPEALGQAAFSNVVENYYMTDQISRASQIMAKCTNTLLPQRQSNYLPKPTAVMY
eukprot:GILK01002079.1.p1 GENE.GILK01002079.1~~GILK01002079.1.p1  ORF type:complete len:751 (+),score=105.23 GILK01002079.1:243-2255(+)